MTKEQQQHLDNVIKSFSEKCSIKYEKGQKEHGGDLWRKKRMIDFIIDEAIDMVVYAETLKEQLKGLDIGEIEE